MSSLLASFQSAGNALQQFEKAAGVSENNVVNASTPGYAAQYLRFQAQSFDPDQGLYGGVQAGPVESARDQYAESAVRRQTSQEGLYTQLASSLSGLQSAFD